MKAIDFLKQKGYLIDNQYHDSNLQWCEVLGLIEETIEALPKVVMKWTPVDMYTQLPEVEVLAIGDKKEILLGYLGMDGFGGIQCENQREILYDVYAYIEIRDIRKTAPDEPL